VAAGKTRRVRVPLDRRARLALRRRGRAKLIVETRLRTAKRSTRVRVTVVAPRRQT
jgi:hypothetical protein